MTYEEFDVKHRQLLHALQTGIMYMLEKQVPNYAPIADFKRDDLLVALKHMRVGIDSAKCEHGVMAQILIDKGIITAEEYRERMMAGYEKEVKMYERTLSELLGKNITLA